MPSLGHDVAPMVVRPLGARDGLALGLELHQALVQPFHLVDRGDHIAQALLDLLLRQFVVVEDRDLLDGPLPFRQVLSEREHLLDDDGRTRQGFEDVKLAALDAFGDFHFPFAREQRHGAHFAQVHADGVVGFVERPGGQVKIDIFGAFFGLDLIALIEHKLLRRFDSRRFQDLDALAVQHRQQVIQLLGRMNVRREQVVHLVVEEIPLLFAQGDELANLVEFVLKCQCSGPPATDERLALLIWTPETQNGDTTSVPWTRCLRAACTMIRKECRLSGFTPPN